MKTYLGAEKSGKPARQERIDSTTYVSWSNFTSNDQTQVAIPAHNRFAASTFAVAADQPTPLLVRPPHALAQLTLVENDPARTTSTSWLTTSAARTQTPSV